MEKEKEAIEAFRKALSFPFIRVPSDAAAWMEVNMSDEAIKDFARKKYSTAL